jgi:L-lactate dehydrogenase complex protein LldE
LQVALFITCYNDTLFPETGKAVVRVLERLGHTVVFPAGQTCCGQMHYNTGYQQEAMPLLERFVSQFRTAEAIVVPSSSCVAMMKDHYPQMAAHIGKPELIRDVAELLPRIFEFSEFLTRKLGLEDVGAYYPHRVTYHASCHGLRNLGLGDGPQRLLKHVRGIDLVPIANRTMLRLWRNLRGQERRSLERHARRKNHCGPQHRSRGLHRLRQQLPHAHPGRSPSPAHRRPHRPPR